MLWYIKKMYIFILLFTKQLKLTKQKPKGMRLHMILIVNIFPLIFNSIRVWSLIINWYLCDFRLNMTVSLNSTSLNKVKDDNPILRVFSKVKFLPWNEISHSESLAGITW